MAVTLDKITTVVVDHEGIQYRGIPTKITGQHVTFKITTATGLETGIRYPWVTGRVITAQRGKCSQFR